MTSPSPMPWIKVYTKILNDPRIGRLSDEMKWRYLSLCLLAANIDKPGELPFFGVMCKRLDQSPSVLASELYELTKRGLLEVISAEQPPIPTNDRVYPESHFWAIGLWGAYKWRIRSFEDFIASSYDLDAFGLWKNLRLSVMHRDSWVCQYCGAPAEHVDHIIPKCQGGTDEPENLVAACINCNLVKGGRTPKQANMELLQ